MLRMQESVISRSQSFDGIRLHMELYVDFVVGK